MSRHFFETLRQESLNRYLSLLLLIIANTFSIKYF
ncbi:unnamed protein product [Tenebrio molitor]|nr:unnamed protein product [Tenebrio molitor]